MLSLDKGPHAIEIATLYEGQPDEHTPKMEGKQLYWLPKKNKQYRMGIDDAADFLKSDEFRIRYRLSHKEQEALQECLLRDNCPEGSLVKKFYEIREDLETRLYTEMELGESQYLRVDLPADKKEFSKHYILIGSTNVGKSTFAMQQALQSVKGPLKGKRQIVWASSELQDDKTIKPLLTQGLKKWVTTIDTSQEAYDEWVGEEEHSGGVQEWYNEMIKPHLVPDKGGHVFLDDSPDSPASKQLMHFQNRAFRTLRHKLVGVTSLQHKIRGGQYTSQAFSSVSHVIFFPRGGGKGNLIKFLADDIGFGIRKARELVSTFSEGGRWMAVRLWAPGALIGSKYCILT